MSDTKYELSELSKETLKNYLRKSYVSNSTSQFKKGIDVANKINQGNYSSDDLDKKVPKRIAGLYGATRRLAKEETEATLNTLRDAIVEQDASAIEESFSSLIHDRLSYFIESRAEELSSDLFGDRYVVLDESELDEGAGNLSNLPSHVIKHLTKNHIGAGENSSVTKSGKINSPSELHKHIQAGLDNGHAVAVHVNGKLHKVASSTRPESSGSRTEYNVHTNSGQETHKELIHRKPVRRGGKIHYPAPYEVTKREYTKGEAKEHLQPSSEKSFYKDNHVEVTHIGSDPNTRIKQQERQKNKPEMQSNFVKATDAEKNDKSKWNRLYGSSLKKSSTPAGDMSKIKDAAAHKLADKYVKPSAAQSEAKQLHAALGKHIEAGDFQKAKLAAHNLHAHIQQHGVESDSARKTEYADNLRKLKSTYSKDDAKKNLARLRNESEESTLEEVIDLLISSYEA